MIPGRGSFGVVFEPRITNKMPQWFLKSMQSMSSSVLYSQIRWGNTSLKKPPKKPFHGEKNAGKKNKKPQTEPQRRDHHQKHRIYKLQ